MISLYHVFENQIQVESFGWLFALLQNDFFQLKTILIKHNNKIAIKWGYGLIIN